VIHGHKIWTSGADKADYMFGLFRTEPDAPKHAGISYLLLEMNQPGIEVRPLRQMTGAADFNEVFFTNAKTPKDWIVGKRGEGWLVSRTTLKHERNMIGDAQNALATFSGLVRLARETLKDGKPAIQNAAIRQRLVQLEGYVRAHQYSGYRQLTKASKGEDPGRVQLMNKLTSTNIGHEVAKLALEILGDDGLYEPGERMLGGPRDNAGWVGQFMWSLGSAVAGGTANIQRNVIGERGLGLPRDAAASGK
jgi:alkylation response protein AidB-like acyl-CoA dehydrogenase